MRRNLTFFSLFLLASASVVSTGCDSDVDIGGFGGNAATSTTTTADGTSTDASSTADGTSTDTSTSTGFASSVAIRLRSTTMPVAHDDGLSGQTPLAHASGLRSLRLYRDAADPSPYVPFDLGQNAVEASYDDGADTLVATVDGDTIPRTTFTRARVVHSHVRYRIAATAHMGMISAPGTFDNMQVMSDGSMVDGMLRDAGYFEYEFTTASGLAFPLTGNDAPSPEWTGGGGFDVAFENGEWAYYFPVNLPIPEDLSGSHAVVLTVNMHESFRWQDQPMQGYVDGVFDATATSFEPVMRFGPSSFALTVE